MRSLRITPYTVFHSLARGRAKRFLYYALLNAYPPNVGAGIRVSFIADDLMTFQTRMRLHVWNRNFVGTQYGGSLYAMCDPYFMLILIEAMGRDYIVWDKAASIRFRKPARGIVKAEFRVMPQTIDELREILRSTDKHDATFRTQILDKEGEVVAEVEKVIHLRKKASSTGKIARFQ